MADRGWSFMKMIEVTCDYCEKTISKGIVYGSLTLPLLPEVNFCGSGCFHDWVMEIYLKRS
jgi:hypothetical protein